MQDITINYSVKVIFFAIIEQRNLFETILLFIQSESKREARDTAHFLLINIFFNQQKLSNSTFD